MPPTDMAQVVDALATTVLQQVELLAQVREMGKAGNAAAQAHFNQQGQIILPRAAMDLSKALGMLAKSLAAYGPRGEANLPTGTYHDLRRFTTRLGWMAEGVLKINKALRGDRTLTDE